MRKICYVLSALLICSFHGVFAGSPSSATIHTTAKTSGGTLAANTVISVVRPELMLYALTIEPQPPQEGGLLGEGKIRIINLGPIINHEGVDYAPTVSADGRTLYYVSERRGSKLRTDGKGPSHDFWAAKKNNNLDTVFFTPFNIDTSITYGNLGVNTQRNEGAASIAADKQTLVFTGCNRKEDGLGDCDLYITEIDGDKWSKPKNMGRKVNSEWWDSQPSIAPDRSRIYFCSNRPGPNGEDNFDIWYTDWDDDAQEWKQAVNAGPQINTSGKERSPFIAADNETLFFASDGHKPNLGGTDFYYVKRDGDAWGKVETVGAPINSPQDEEFITLPASGDVLYFSSRRTDISGAQGNLDIYMAFVPSFFKATILTGVVLDECTNANIPSTIEVVNPITRKIFRDTLNGLSKTNFELVISNTDFGPPKDSVKSFDMQVTAFSPTYGKTVKSVTITKPSKTKNEAESKKSVEVSVELKLGKRPELGAEMEYAPYIVRQSKKEPTLAGWKGLLMEEQAKIELYPLLNYVFFDEGSAEIPKRYTMFKSNTQTASFNDERIPGQTLDKYYNVLNIYAYRMKKYPNIKCTITGCNDNVTPSEKSLDLSKQRAQVVYDYLTNVWGIDASRLKTESRALPKTPSTTGDTAKISKQYSIVENRRTELTFEGDPEEIWQVMRPIYDNDPKMVPTPEKMTWTLKNGIEELLIAKRRIEISRDNKEWNTLTNVGVSNPTAEWNWHNKADDELSESVQDEAPFKARLVVTSKNGTECASDPVHVKVKVVKKKGLKIDVEGEMTKEKYNLILFPFDSYAAGAFNERILKEYVYPRCKPLSEITVEGHTDVVGMFNYNQKLSLNRSKTVETGIKNATKGQFKVMNVEGKGEEEPLFDNELPEGRLYNRTVQVRISSPVSEDEF